MLDSSRCLGFFTNKVWIVGPLGQALKHNFRLKFCFSGYSAGIHITHQTSKHGFVAIQCASINVLPTFFLYVRFFSRVHLKCEFQVPYSNLNIIRHATKLWLEMNQTILMAVYNHFWPFLTICIFSQNWDSDGHFEVLNESKSWLLQISWHISVVSKNSLNSCYFSAS